MKRFVIVTVFLGAGLAAGFVIAGKLEQTSSSYAQVPSTPRPSTPAAAAASQGLPDLSAIADRAIQASANISSTQVVRQRNSPLMEFYSGRQFTEAEAQSLGSGVVVSVCVWLGFRVLSVRSAVALARAMARAVVPP